MKFADKYEILEMVTSGRVSTFLARERTTQQPVVVYTFECAGSSASDLNTASIVAKFASLAPSPPGVIVKAGFDEASSSAFITTKMPETSALQEWVRGYHAFGKPITPVPPAQPLTRPPSDETAELSAAELRAYFAAQKEPKPAEPGWGTAEFAIDGSPQGGEFTQLFRELNAFQPVRPSEAPSPKAPTATDADLNQRLGGVRLGAPEKPAPVQPVPAPPVVSSPGAFTREFLGLSSSASEMAPSSTGSHEPAREQPGAFTKEFLGMPSQSPEPSSSKVSDARAVPSGPPSIFGSVFGSVPQKPASAPTSFESPSPAQTDTSGEFTNFFRDPFETPGTPQTSPGVPDFASVEPAKERPGDFTRVFGPGGQPESLTPGSAQDVTPPAGSFTQIFADNPAAKASPLGGTLLGTNPNLKSPHGSSVIASPEPSRPAAPAVSPPPIVDPFFGPPRVTPPPDQGFLNRPVSSTTNVFRPGEAPPVEQVPSGPSEFTVFLNRSQLKAVLPPDVVLPSEKAAAAPVLPNPFAAPPLPPFPAVTRPAMPAPPAMPKPAVPAIPSKPASLWPLITVLTALLAIGAMLVMYFVMKH